MEVLVETLTGTAFEMTVSPSDTIFAIKSKIFRVEGEFRIPSTPKLYYTTRSLRYEWRFMRHIPTSRSKSTKDVFETRNHPRGHVPTPSLQYNHA